MKMKKRKIFGILIILLSVFLLTGCEQTEVKEKELEVDGETIDTKDMVHEYCTRTGTLDGGSAEATYDIYYTGEVLNVLRAEEKVISSSDTVLDEYESAFEAISAHYDGLEYYDSEVIRGDTTVRMVTIINYDKIDIEELISIEGADDNIVEDGIAKVDKWKELSKKVGVTCTKVTEEA